MRRPARRRFSQLSQVGQWQARAYAVRPTPGRFVCPHLAHLCLPAGYRAVVDPTEARALGEQLPAVYGVLREDSRRTRQAVWAAVVDLLDPDTGIVVGTQGTIGERASVHAGYRVARATAGNHLRDLLAAGVLWQEQTMRGASKEALGAERGRAGSYVILAPGEPLSAAETDDKLTPEHQAAVDALAARLATQEDADDAPVGKPVEELGQLPERSASTRVGDISPPRMYGHFPSSKPESAPKTGGAAPHPVTRPSRLGSWGPGPVRREHPERFAPRDRRERELAVVWLIAVMGWQFNRAEEELGKITAPWFGAGWSPAAVLHAWRHQPDGSPWPGPLPEPHQRDRRDPIRIRRLWAVLTWRLAAWRNAAGQPGDAPVPAERPRRGRPARVAPSVRHPEPRPGRSAEAEAELAIARAQLAQQAADRAAEAEAERRVRERRRATLAALPGAFPAPVEPPPVDDDQAAADRWRRIVLRARVDRAARNRGATNNA